MATRHCEEPVGRRGNPVLSLETWGPAYADSSFRRRSSIYGGQVGKAGWIAASLRSS